MTEERPEFEHRRERHGLIGPFSGKQLLLAAALIAIVAVIGVAITTPLGNTAIGPNIVNPQATPFIIGEAPAEGLRPGMTAPEFSVALDDGTTYQLTDLDGRPIRMADLRGKVVWLNFWASWCPPCQQETPILRELDAKYRDRGLAIVGVSVQETTPDDVEAYADRYELDYTIGFDGSGHILRTYRVFALPTQFFINTDGVIEFVLNGPVDQAGATALLEQMLGAVPSDPGPS